MTVNIYALIHEKLLTFMHALWYSLIQEKDYPGNPFGNVT